MEEAKGEVKHILSAKFKEGTSQEEIDDLIKGYANFVTQIEPMKAFQWWDKVTNFVAYLMTKGTDVSIENLHQGFTHIFESSFESTEGVAKYVSNPVHVEFADLFLSKLDKVLVQYERF